MPLIRKKKGKKRGGAEADMDLEQMDKQARKRLKEATTTVSLNGFAFTGCVNFLSS